MAENTKIDILKNKLIELKNAPGELAENTPLLKIESKKYIYEKIIIFKFRIYRK